MENINQITPGEIKEWLQNGHTFFLLDVREEDERAAFNIGGHFIPMDDVMASVEVIPRDIPVVIYCRKGIRSAIVIQRLQQRFGFTNLLNLYGGMVAWQSMEAAGAQ